MRVLKKLPGGLIGMIALIVIVESWLSAHQYEYKAGSQFQWSRQGRAARRDSTKYDILCYGDSLVNYGIQPNTIEAVTGNKTLNLGLIGGQASTTYFQLRRSVESGAKPKAVVVDFFALLLNHGKEENDERWPEFLSARECLELAIASQDSRFFAKNMVSKLLFSYKERLGIRKFGISALKGTPYTERYSGLAHFRSWKLNHGSSIFARNPNLNLGDLNGFHKAAFMNADWMTRYHAIFMKRFFDLAAEHQIKIYWVVPPLQPDVQAKFAEKGEDIRFDRLISGVLAKYPNVTVVDARQSTYPSEVFVDHGHLDRVGANTFSQDVGNVIKASSDERWVKLPAFRMLPEQPPLEDFRESETVVLKDQGIIPR